MTRTIPKSPIRLLLFFVLPSLVIVSSLFLLLVLLQEWDKGCTGRRDVPLCGPGAQRGKAYSYAVHTYWGIANIGFDGRRWVADPFLVFTGGHPLPGWDNPRARGKIELISRDRARFTTSDGQVGDFLTLLTGKAGLVAEFRPLFEDEVFPLGGRICA